MDFNEGLAVVLLDDKCNFINTNGTIQYPNLDVVYCESFHSGYAVVGIKSDIPGYLNYNILNKNGNIMFKEWFTNKFDIDNVTILGSEGMAVRFDHNDGKLTLVGKAEYNSSPLQNESRIRNIVHNTIMDFIKTDIIH